ncbi:hypothetical protein ZWY2020_051217 [Hordeum vulgare]|nr:hypothetical protein ZWY2020_051217 [Hordeum vulgare]
MEAVLRHPSLSRLKAPNPAAHRTQFLQHCPCRPRVPKRRLAAAALFQDQTNPRTAAASKGGDEEDEEGYGEVDRIVSSRTVKNAVFAEDGSATTVTATEYLVEWKDGHEPTWIPAEAIAADVLAEYETPWWMPPRRPMRMRWLRCWRTRRCGGTRTPRTRRGARRCTSRRGSVGGVPALAAEAGRTWATRSARAAG